MDRIWCDASLYVFLFYLSNERAIRSTAPEMKHGGQQGGEAKVMADRLCLLPQNPAGDFDPEKAHESG